ncbi:hypothetical protein JIN82_10475 [Persicirhabdus sediminis]|uniref:Uncharacterized protein n=1 Tax=Persicirhabdus sediminis TaxID=454144 RepID=A0A8J7SK84_9BACT|nr:hypothetical protein [Persicirhabdus sediminis]
MNLIEETQRRRHGEGLTRAELMLICESVLDEAGAEETAHIEGDEESGKLTASEMLRQMLQSQWLEEPRRSDYQRVYYLDSRAELMLDFLRRIAFPEKVTFTDKLHLACTRLQDETAFTDHPLSDLEACLDNLRYGLQELRAVQQGVAQLTQRQLKSDSIKENLDVLYNDFSENIGQRCYRQLVALDLPLRLPVVTEALQDIAANPQVLARMESELAQRRPDLLPGQVASEVAKNMQEALDLLNCVEPQSDAVDRRAAEFARRSFARFRYLQEVSSGRRSEVRELFESVNALCEGAKMADLPDELDLPELRLPSVGLLSGLDSLNLPRSVHHKGERQPLEDFDDYDDQMYAVDEMSDSINSSLTSLRANRYYRTLQVPVEGMSSALIDASEEEWLLETIGLLLHSDTADCEYTIDSPREENVTPPVDELGDYAVDRFEIHPKARP